jgi:toxin HigB-1
MLGLLLAILAVYLIGETVAVLLTFRRIPLDARQLNDLRAPPANRSEALTGNRRGQYSIRINDQWRICFTWTKEGPADVEIIDYH